MSATLIEIFRDFSPFVPRECRYSVLNQGTAARYKYIKNIQCHVTLIPWATGSRVIKNKIGGEYERGGIAHNRILLYTVEGLFKDRGTYLDKVKWSKK